MKYRRIKTIYTVSCLDYNIWYVHKFKKFTTGIPEYGDYTNLLYLDTLKSVLKMIKKSDGFAFRITKECFSKKFNWLEKVFCITKCT